MDKIQKLAIQGLHMWVTVKHSSLQTFESLLKSINPYEIPIWSLDYFILSKFDNLSNRLFYWKSSEDTVDLDWNWNELKQQQPVPGTIYIVAKIFHREKWIHWIYQEGDSVDLCLDYLHSKRKPKSHIISICYENIHGIKEDFTPFVHMFIEKNIRHVHFTYEILWMLYQLQSKSNFHIQPCKENELFHITDHSMDDLQKSPTDLF